MCRGSWSGFPEPSETQLAKLVLKAHLVQVPNSSSGRAEGLKSGRSMKWWKDFIQKSRCRHSVKLIIKLQTRVHFIGLFKVIPRLNWRVFVRILTSIRCFFFFLMSSQIFGWPSFLTAIKTDSYLEFTDLTLVNIWVQLSFLRNVGFWVALDNCLVFLSFVQFILFSLSVIIPDTIVGRMLCWLVACLSLDLLFVEMSTCVWVSTSGGEAEREVLSKEFGLLSRNSFSLLLSVYRHRKSSARQWDRQRLTLTSLLNRMCSSQTVQRMNDIL